MHYRQVGCSGLRVSVVGVGCNNFGTRICSTEVEGVVSAALDIGITLFDTAPAYGRGASEDLLGQALAGRREQAVIATKCAYRVSDDPCRAPGSRHAIRREVHASLTRLRTDYIDLYQMHFRDPMTPIEETQAAMAELVAEGKVLYIGSCNLAAWEVVAADAVAKSANRERWISTQAQYSLLDRSAEVELLPASTSLGIGFLPYYPLANGLLTGKYRRGEQPPPGSRLAADDRRHLLTDARLRSVEALTSFAQARGRSILELAVAALLARSPVASVIAGARSAEQVAQNAAAAAWRLDRDDLVELDDVLTNLDRIHN